MEARSLLLNLQLSINLSERFVIGARHHHHHHHHRRRRYYYYHYHEALALLLH